MRRISKSPAAADIITAMKHQEEQIFSKTLKGIDAARGRSGLSPKVQSILRLVDGTKNVAELTAAAKSSGASETEIRAAFSELQQAGLVRLVERPSEASKADNVSAEVENQLRLTLDFTKKAHDHQQDAAAAAKSASANAFSVGTPAASSPSPSAPGTATPADHEARAREARAARLKMEAEIRQKLVTALQPRIEEELRKRLRPRLEEELRPKLIAALRPGLEAEVRTALVKELTPRIELELKARFAKTLAAQKAASEQAVKEVAEAAPPRVPEAPVAAAATAGGRVLANLSTPVFSVDKAGVCTYMTPAWVQFSGYAVDEVVGRQLTDFFDEKSRRAIAAMLSGVCNGTALRFEQQGMFARKDGSSSWVEVMAAPLYSLSGDADGVCGSFRDVGELRRITTQAEADGVRLLLLVDQIDTGVLLENAAGEIQQVNPAFCALLSVDAAPYSLEGLPVSELLEQVSQGFIGPEGFLRRIADMRNAGDEVKGESFILADGRVIEQDYLAVTAGEETVGRVWLFREVRRSASREPRSS